MAKKTKTQLLETIANSDALPALSPLAIQLIELAADDRSSAMDLAAVIEKDPGLTTRLLKTVGSAFFTRPESVTSIAQAVVLVGFKKVRMMALSLSLRHAFPMDKSKGMDFQLFWKMSLYRALMAKDLVQARPSTENLGPEEAFMAGLIAEIGMLLLFSYWADTREKGFPKGDLSLDKIIPWEEKTFGVNHRELGSMVLQRWRFPENLVECQRCFGGNALKAHAPALCKTVELARRATDVVFGETAALHTFQALVQEKMGLDPGTVNSILARAFGEVEELAQQLLLKVDSQEDILAVMEKANQALVRINSSMETAFTGLLDQANQINQPLDTESKEQSERQKDILQNTLDAVAHEIRNPLLAIGGFSKRLAREAGGKGQGSEYAKIIAEESARLEGILQEVTEYCQGYRPHLIQEDLIAILDHVLEEAGSQIKKGKIEVVRDFPDKPVFVLAERMGITRTLRLLVGHAISAMDKTQKGLIKATVRFDHRGISVMITDNGQPISDDIRDILVDGNLSSKTFSGNLHWAMARKIIDAHKGSISYTVEKGRENRVMLLLPALEGGAIS